MSCSSTKESFTQLGDNRVKHNHPQRVISVNSKQSTSTKHCICPQCGMKVKNQKGTPCVDTYCPFCGTPMSGK